MGGLHCIALYCGFFGSGSVGCDDILRRRLALAILSPYTLTLTNKSSCDSSSFPFLRLCCLRAIKARGCLGGVSVIGQLQLHDKRLRLHVCAGSTSGFEGGMHGTFGMCRYVYGWEMQQRSRHFCSSFVKSALFL